MDKHDLLHEFPEHQTKIHELKLGDPHFKKLFDEYHDANKEIHRIETGAEVTKDEVLTDLRKQSLVLKDELYAMLTAN